MNDSYKYGILRRYSQFDQLRERVAPLLRAVTPPFPPKHGVRSATWGLGPAELEERRSADWPIIVFSSVVFRPNFGCSHFFARLRCTVRPIFVCDIGKQYAACYSNRCDTDNFPDAAREQAPLRAGNAPETYVLFFYRSVKSDAVTPMAAFTHRFVTHCSALTPPPFPLLSYSWQSKR